MGYESNEEILGPSNPNFNNNHDGEMTESNKVEMFDSSRALNNEDFLNQQTPTLAATKKKNLKRT